MLFVPVGFGVQPSLRHKPLGLGIVQRRIEQVPEVEIQVIPVENDGPRI